jgi:hypothetical protein
MVEQCFYSIEIRDLNFEYDRYYLSLEQDPNDFLIIDNNIINNKFKAKLPKDAISDITPYTIVPKFSVDKISTPILFQILNIDYNTLNKKEKKEFNIINKQKEVINEEEDKEKEENEIINDINEINEDNKINNIIEKDEDEDENNIININNEHEKDIKNKKELYLENINMKELTINVKSYTSKKIVFSFQLRYPLFPDFYTYLGETPDKFKILQYPCILLQYESGSTRTNQKVSKNPKKSKNKNDIKKNDNIQILKSGYYSLKKIIISEHEGQYYDEEINFAISADNDDENNENKNFFEQLFTERKNRIPEKIKNFVKLHDILFYKGSYDSTMSTLSDKKKELIKKKNELKEIINKKRIILEKIKEIAKYDKQIELNKNSWNRLVTLKEVLNKINIYTAEVILLKEKKLLQSEEIINKYKKEIEEKNKKIPNLQKINKGLEISNFFLIKYAISEICYLFFNKNINKYNAFPSFYELNINEIIQKKKNVSEFYNKYFREVSTLFGNIIYLLTYISKKFDIIFPYSLYYNGSKSMVFIKLGNKSFGIDLHIKENDKNLSFGNKQYEIDIYYKMEIISKMIYDVIMYFYSKGICSDKFKMDDFNGKKRKKKNNMFLNFKKLNEMFKDILDLNKDIK